MSLLGVGSFDDDPLSARRISRSPSGYRLRTRHRQGGKREPSAAQCRGEKFREEEGHSGGGASAMVSKTKKVGFVGGMDFH